MGQVLPLLPSNSTLTPHQNLKETIHIIEQEQARNCSRRNHRQRFPQLKVLTTLQYIIQELLVCRELA
jgi:hypothetical protein